MTEKVAAQFKKLLLARRMELSRKLVQPRDDAHTDQLLQDPDPGDPGLSLDPEFSLQSRQVQEMLMAMDAALARIAGGTFGECMICGQEIGTKRLVAFPWARFCLACQDAGKRRH